MKLPRPKSILWFERFYFASLAISLLDAYLLWDQTIASVDTDLETDGLGAIIYISMWVVGLGISLAVWFFAAIKAKPWAKWTQLILVSMFVISIMGELLVLLVPDFEDMDIDNIDWDEIVWPYYLTGFYFFSTILGVVATYMLFRRDAVHWFEVKRLEFDEVFD